MAQARPIRPPEGYHVRPERSAGSTQWRAVARYGEWHGPLRADYLRALEDARGHHLATWAVA